MPASPEQLHDILLHCMDFAKLMLTDSGEFYPFGATLDADGQITAQGGWDGNEHPNPVEIYKLLGEAFAAGARDGSFAAAALAANVNVPPECEAPAPDGLRLHLETSGYSRFIYVPYVLHQRGFLKKRKEVQFYDPISVEIPPSLFARGSDA